MRLGDPAALQDAIAVDPLASARVFGWLDQWGIGHSGRISGATLAAVCGVDSRSWRKWVGAERSMPLAAWRLLLEVSKVDGGRMRMLKDWIPELKQNVLISCSQRGKPRVLVAHRTEAYPEQEAFSVVISGYAVTLPFSAIASICREPQGEHRGMPHLFLTGRIEETDDSGFPLAYFP